MTYKLQLGSGTSLTAPVRYNPAPGGAKGRHYWTPRFVTPVAPYANRGSTEEFHTHTVGGGSRFGPYIEKAASDGTSTWDIGASNQSVAWDHTLKYDFLPGYELMAYEHALYEVEGDTEGQPLEKFDNGLQMTGIRSKWHWAKGNSPHVLVINVFFPQFQIPGVLSHFDMPAGTKFDGHVSYKMTRLHTKANRRLVAVIKYRAIPDNMLKGKTPAEIKAIQDDFISHMSLSSGPLDKAHAHIYLEQTDAYQDEALAKIKQGGAWEAESVNRAGKPGRDNWKERFTRPDGTRFMKNSSRLDARYEWLLFDGVNPEPSFQRPPDWDATFDVPDVDDDPDDIDNPPPIPEGPVDIPEGEIDPVPPVDTPPAEDPPTDLPDNTTALDLINQARGIMDRLEVEVRKG